MCAMEVKVMGEPESPDTDAVVVCAPAPAPRVRVTVAVPLTSVWLVGLETDPPPLAAAQLTATPETGASEASLTTTESAVARTVPAGATWLSPATLAICVGVGPLPVPLSPLLQATAAARARGIATNERTRIESSNGEGVIEPPESTPIRRETACRFRQKMARYRSPAGQRPLRGMRT